MVLYLRLRNHGRDEGAGIQLLQAHIKKFKHVFYGFDNVECWMEFHQRAIWVCVEFLIELRSCVALEWGDKSWFRRDVIHSINDNYDTKLVLI